MWLNQVLVDLLKDWFWPSLKKSYVSHFIFSMQIVQILKLFEQHLNTYNGNKIFCRNRQKTVKNFDANVLFELLEKLELINTGSDEIIYWLGTKRFFISNSNWKFSIYATKKSCFFDTINPEGKSIYQVNKVQGNPDLVTMLGLCKNCH